MLSSQNVSLRKVLVPILCCVMNLYHYDYMSFFHLINVGVVPDVPDYIKYHEALYFLKY